MISRRARYALHGLSFLAKVGDRRPVPFSRIEEYLKTWSHELSLSAGYVAKIFQDLSRAGLVRSVPGRKGGYILGRAAAEISVKDVLRAIDGVGDESCCFLSVGECTLQHGCRLSQVLDQARGAFFRVLEKENLATLARKMALPPGFEVAVPSQSRSPRS